jgi:hypothetical protein
MALEPLADGVWFTTAPVSFLGLELTSTMTVLRLGDGSLLVHSPVALTPERKSEVDSLGRVAHLYSPNTFHYLRLGEWSAAYPNARVHASRGLASKRRDLRIDRFHGDTEPDFAGAVDELPIDGFRLEESALFYRPARTLVVADLVHNIGSSDHAWTRFYARMMGFYDRVAVSRVIRLTAFDDRRAARRSVDAVCALPFDRIVVGHGAPIVTDAHRALEAAYAWLPHVE